MRQFVVILWLFLHAFNFRTQAGIPSTTRVNATAPIAEAEEVEPIKGIMNAYQASHGYEALLLDKNACSRQFLVGDWSCRQIARHTLGFLDVLEVAVLSNQTFVARFCESNVNESDCTITPMRWVPTIAKAVSILKKQGCTSKVQELSPFMRASSCVSSNGSSSDISHNSTNSTLSKWTEKVLNMYGSEAKHGALFDSCFDYAQSVLNSSEQVLKSSVVISGMGRERAFIMGIHARHSTEMIQSGFTKYIEEKDCIKHVLLDSRPTFGDRYCILVVSTDRNHTLVGLSTFAGSIGCEVLNAKEKKEAELYRNDGFAMIADLHLLSQVDYFLGSTQGEQFMKTPFSSLVASIVAYNHRSDNNILWVPSDTCDKDTVIATALNASLIEGLINSTNGPAGNAASTQNHILCNPSFVSEFEGKAIKGTRGREVFVVENW